MEKIYQFASDKTPLANNNTDYDCAIQLKNKHLWIAAEVAQQAFGDVQQVYAVYYANLKILLLAPMTDTMFKQAHDCSMLFLKTRSVAGDKSLSLEEIIIDHDLDDKDRPLQYVGAPGLQMLQIMIA